MRWREGVRNVVPMGSRPERNGVVTAIGVFKLVKVVVLVAAGLGTLKVLRGGPADLAESLSRWAHVDPRGTVVQHLFARIGVLSERQLEEVAFGTFLYAALFLVEGVGLLARQHWAEWFTVLITGSFIPLEVWHLVREPSAAKVITVVINVAVVAYLVARIVRRRHGPGPSHLTPGRPAHAG